MRLAIVVASGIALLGCRDRSSSDAPAPAPTVPIVAETVPAPPAPSASSPSKPKGDIPPFKPSVKPSLAEWCSAKAHWGEVGDGFLDNGDPHPDVAVLGVREWVLVACPSSVRGGNLTSRSISEGGSVLNETAAESRLLQDYGAVFLARSKPDTTLTVTCHYAGPSEPRIVRLSWPAETAMADRLLDDKPIATVLTDAKAPVRFAGACDAALHPSQAAAGGAAAPATSASASTRATAGAAPTSSGPAPTLPDLPGWNELPTDATWAAAKEVTFPGSSSASCETKTLPGWFRAVCKGSFEQADVEVGKYETQTKLSVASGTMTLLTPLFDGTDFAMKMSGGGKSFRLLLKWHGPRPQAVGRVDAL